MQTDAVFDSLLSGSQGQAAKTAAEILLALGEIYGAVDMVPVKAVQIAGVSYHNLGEAGLEYLQDMARDGKVRVQTMLNPAGMDLERYQEMGIDEDFASKQQLVMAAFRALGVQMSCTCTPYLAGYRPVFGEHVAWAESSAVTFANSVLGARTNREGGPSALAAAICGATPRYGLHLDEKRQPTLRVELQTELKDYFEWGLLGQVIGSQAPGSLPYIVGAADPGEAPLKALSAALPTFGGQPMFHVDKVTPEAAQCQVPDQVLAVTRAMLDASRELLESQAERVDLVTIGCPHASLDELRAIDAAIAGRGLKVPLWISTSRVVDAEAREQGLQQRIEHSGARIWRDTCFAVAPLRGRFSRVATNSAKGCFYGSGHNLFAMRIGSLEQCVDAALSGVWK